MTDRFQDRRDAGRQLAARLSHLAGADPIVLALPRGGVPVAAEIARALHAPLQLLLVRKIGAPGYPELAIGAIVDGEPPQTVLNDELVARVGASQEYLQAETRRQLAELERRRSAYGVEQGAPAVRGRTAIVVDDGVATGSTLQAALQALGRAGAGRRIAAIPVAPPDAGRRLAADAEEWVCLLTPPNFMAVGNHYRDFDQLEDEDVMQALREAGEPAP